MSLIATIFLSPFRASAIINGTVVEPMSTMAKSTVIVLWKSYFSTGHGQCSGTLIAPDIVLTAAHCVQNPATSKPFSAEEMTGHFGPYNGAEWNKAFVYDVQGLRSNENFDPEITRNDLAVLRLAKPAPEGFTPVSILEDITFLQPGTDIVLAGYGNTLWMGDRDEPKSRMLRSFPTKIEQPVSPEDGMIEFYKTRDLVRTFGILHDKTPRHPELDNEGGMAAGDSGGPAFLFTRGAAYVVGVASGYYGSDDTVPSYENVATHAGWINSSVRALRENR